jgi:hypothetical protein
VPRVTNRLLDAVIFVYRNENEAATGAAIGATGCLVSYPYKAEWGHGMAHLYAVTNSHVVKRDGRGRVVRINRLGGGAEIVELAGDRWEHHDDADVAAALLEVDQGQLRLADIPIEIFLTENDLSEQTFIEGDDCMFIGRHYGLDGKQRNTPAVRMGSVAIMRPDPVNRERDYGRHEESIALEARSLGGFSGSPVFLWQSGILAPPVCEDLFNGGKDSLIGKVPVVVHSSMERRFAFLGITWGHMQGRNVTVIDPDVEPEEGGESERSLILNSGIMLAVPAWRVLQLLEREDLAAQREAVEAKEAKQH